jgi:hypothetical protein
MKSSSRCSMRSTSPQPTSQTAISTVTVHTFKGGCSYLGSMLLARDDVQNSWRYSSTTRKFGQGGSCKRRLTRGLEYHGTACCKSRPNLSRYHTGRPVPWCYEAANTNWLLGGVRSTVLVGRGNGFTVHARRFFTEPFQKVGCVNDFVPCVCHRFTADAVIFVSVLSCKVQRF